jgi:hypothetical protein
MAGAGEETKAVEKAAPGRYKVRSTHPGDRKRILFSTVSEQRARAYVERKFPRGSEAYLERPDNGTEHYEAERQDEYGVEQPVWAEFDPESWVPPSEQEPPGQAAWADVEG